MDRLRYFLTDHWLDLLCVFTALVVAGVVALRFRRGTGWSLGGPILAASLALFGLGGLTLPGDWAGWLGAGAGMALFCLVLVVVVTGRWSAVAGYVVGALLLFAVGGLAGPILNERVWDAAKNLARLEPTQPWWLLLLALVPLVVFLSFRSLAGLGPVRRWLAIGLRCVLVILLTLALSEVRIRHQNENVAVMFLVDRSLSIPEDLTPDPQVPNRMVDLRWERGKKFINDSVTQRGPDHKRDLAGVIVFGKRPRVELPPSDAPDIKFNEVSGFVDPNYTDIGAAIKLALASFPEGTAKRIVLLSDGNENLGNAEEQARIAKNNDVQIDVVPLAAGLRKENEVMVQSVEAPPRTEQGSNLPIRVLVRSYNPGRVVGLLTLKQIMDGQVTLVPPSPRRVELRPGLNSFFFRQMLGKQQQSYTYEASFLPEMVIDEKTQTAREGLPGDRPENNRVTTHVLAIGQRRVLIIESQDGEHQNLIDHLRRVGESKFKVYSITPEKLPENRDDLAAYLSDFDCVVLADVAASDVTPSDVAANKISASLSEEQQEVIRSNTRDQGCGLIMIGGPNGFGAGGWQGTPVEKALPVDCDIKALKVQGKGGLVLLMHASEMPDGNRWQKEIAKLAVKKLSPADEVGVMHLDWGQTKWHIPLQEIRGKRESMMRQIDRMVPGDMPEFDTGLNMAFKDLTDPKRELVTKHMIIISDGDPMNNDKAILQKMRQNKVTVTTVGVATHGAPQDQSLSAIAKATGGRFYNVKSPKALPAIYIKETRLVSQSFIYEKRFQPALKYKAGPADKLPDELPSLYGYVRTTLKDNPLVQAPIMAPGTMGQEFPVLAYWTYGLGKSVAFTSDARSMLPDKKFWDKDWAGSEMYLKFWEQVVDWSLRALETGKWTMTTEYRDGKVKVTVDARDEGNRPLDDLEIIGGVTAPAPIEDVHKGTAQSPGHIRFQQKNSGIYEAEFKADMAGSYFVNAQGTRKGKVVKNGKEVEETITDSVRAGVTIPYSPEFSDTETNVPLLEKLRSLTGGQKYADTDEALTAAAKGSEVFRRQGLPPSKNMQPIWYWLLMLTGILLFFDVAVRRIAIEPQSVWAKARQGWEKLRGRAVATEQTPQFFDRLKSRKAMVEEALIRSRSARRFEAEETAAVAPPPPSAAEESPAAAPRAPVRPPPSLQPEKKQEEPADYASRLLKAKKRVWQDREQENQ